MSDPHLMLAIAEGFGERPVAALLAPDLDPERCLAAPPAPPEVPPRVAARLRRPDLADEARRLRSAAESRGIAVLTPRDAVWPVRLATAPLRPLVLFARGSVDALSAAPAVAVVGSRTPTPYGVDATTHFAAALVRAGVVLWSGLARGVDALAHEASVDAGTPTVAVLAGGLDTIYPPEHEALARRIERNGCLVSELPPGRRARRGHFPRRNRLIALGARAVFVVEASLSSGALHTARFAAEYGADVHALPGPWNSERSQGCHRLIAEGALPAEDPETLVRGLGIDADHSGPTALRMVNSADEEGLLRALTAGPRPQDLLQRETGLDRAAFLRALFALETRGAIHRLPGDLFRRAPPFTSR
ncbi:MAG: DNA-protecting protein DprA [Planctomycetes bacterium]|nr:DNA-protecting protein DprA [Planctomycetota bacterium]